METHFINYDPRLWSRGRHTVQTVRLVFARWEHRAVMVVTVNTHTKGLATIGAAVREAYEVLAHSGPYVTLRMENVRGDVYESSDEFNQGPEWLIDMLVEGRILAIEPCDAVRPECDRHSVG